MSNIVVLDYNGIISACSQSNFQLGWNDRPSDHNFFLGTCRSEIAINELVKSFDRHIDHAVLYVGSLRKSYWLTEAVRHFRERFPECTFTIFHCECATHYDMRRWAKQTRTELIHWYKTSHIFPSEIAKMIRDYTENGGCVFFIRALSQDDYWMFDDEDRLNEV